jgi:hypothetical protein
MDVLRHTEERSCNPCYSEKAISITYSECVFVASGVLHGVRMHRIVICGVSGSTIFFFNYPINDTIFEMK